MNLDLDMPPPLPPRLAMFAPWRWLLRLPPIQRYSLIGALLAAAYIEAPVPLIYTLHHTNGSQLPVVLPVLQVTFAPLEWCYRKNDVVRAFYDSQWDLVKKLFGPA